MWMNVVCLVMIAHGALGGDAFLSHLYGLNGKNRVTVCLQPVAQGRGRECPGALLHGELLGVRAGCVRQHPPDRMVALRHSEELTCVNVSHEYSSVRGVTAVYFHPWADLVLIHLNRPYFDLDYHPNSTTWAVSRTFKQYGTWVWIKRYIDAATKARELRIQFMLMHNSMLSNSSPMLLFLMAIVMPLVLLILVFLYVIHYTGNSEEVPYKNLQYT